MTAEIYATDSFQNLLFSIIHFRHLTSHFPTHITLISHAFKRPRFLDLHFPAIRWPQPNLTYVGIDPPQHITSKEILEQGERFNGYPVWEQDLYGVSHELVEKKRKRGWYPAISERIGEGLEEGVKNLLLWNGGKGGKIVYEGELPWDE